MLSVDTLALLIATAFAAGAIDAMAGGGGLLTIPALLAAGVPPVAALATNKLQGACGTGSALIAYARGGHVDPRRFAGHAIAACAGASLGAIAVQHADPRILAGLVPVLLILIALYFLLAPAMGAGDRQARIGQSGMIALAFAIGIYDGFFGPGTGSFFTTALVALGGLGLVRAIGTTKLLNFATNVGALAMMIAGGRMLWELGLGMAAANIAGNQIGARLAMHHEGRGVRPLLVIVSIGLTVRLLADPGNPLRRFIGI